MALTATATFDTFHVVTQRLSMIKPVTVAISPNRQNIKLFVQPSKSLKEFSEKIALDLKLKQKNYPKTIIFARSYKDCTDLYLHVAHCLGKHITVPVGYPNLLKYRLLSMYTRASRDEMKSSIMTSFSKGDGTLRLIIATTSFSMGIDIPDVRQVIHWSPPSDVEQYIQEIGRAGRDRNDSSAILLFDKPNRFTQKSMREYAENKTECRRLNLFSHFIKYEHVDDIRKCKCCDICELSCECTTCKIQ